MDKLVMLVTLLLVAVHEIAASNMMSIDAVMCPDHLYTVVHAGVEKMLRSDEYGNGIYQMFLQITFKMGPNALKIYSKNKITMKFPLNGNECGHSFPVDISKSYIIAGPVSGSGILSSHMCLYMRPTNEVYNDKASLDLLLRIRNATCPP